MSWFSILPSSLADLEIWLVRLFLFLGLVTIGPWLVLVVYDLVLYVLRSALHELPIVGGRARGDQRPRAPSLAARPSGRPRAFSLSLSSSAEYDEAIEDPSSDGADPGAAHARPGGLKAD